MSTKEIAVGSKHAVVVYIGRETALRLRIERFGSMEVPFDPKILSDAQADMLIKIGRMNQAESGGEKLPLLGRGEAKLKSDALELSISIELPEFSMEPLPRNIPQYLDSVIGIFVEAESKVIDAAKLFRPIAYSALERSIDSGGGDSMDPTGVIRSALFGGISGLKMDLGMSAWDVISREADFKALIERRKDAIERRRLERDETAERARVERANQKEEKERLAAEAVERKSLQLKRWVEENGSQVMRSKLRRNLLSNEEVVGAIGAEVFAPLSDWPRYERITDEETWTSYGGEYLDRECPVYYTSGLASEAKDEEIMALEKIESLMPSAKCSLIEHQAYLSTASEEEDERCGIVRRSIEVEVVIGELTLTRKYTPVVPALPA